MDDGKQVSPALLQARPDAALLSARVRKCVDRAVARWRSERGQTAAEYLGVILLVAGIIAAIYTSGVDETIKRELQDLVELTVKGENSSTNDPAN